MCRAYEHAAVAEQPHHIDQGGQRWTVGQVEVVDEEHHATVRGGLEHSIGKPFDESCGIRCRIEGIDGIGGAKCLKPQPIGRCPRRPE